MRAEGNVEVTEAVKALRSCGACQDYQQDIIHAGVEGWSRVMLSAHAILKRCEDVFELLSLPYCRGRSGVALLLSALFTFFNMAILDPKSTDVMMQRWAEFCLQMYLTF